ncbi:MAG: thiamine phosphate synthase [Polyangiaceae bacterium]
MRVEPTGRGGAALVAPPVFLVTDPYFADDAIVRCVEAVARALPVGAVAVQLRDKRRPIASLRVFALRLRQVTRSVRARLFINGDARLARDVGADGVHLGHGVSTVAAARTICGRPIQVSVAVHSDDDVRRALEDGADAALVSPIYSSRSPFRLAVAAGKTARGLRALRAARHMAGSRMRLYALGGVTVERVGECARAGADGVAVIRALLDANDPARAARALYEAWVRC